MSVRIDKGTPWNIIDSLEPNISKHKFSELNKRIISNLGRNEELFKP